MITEKIIAKEFHALWDESLPLLTPSFVRLFNEANSEDLSELPSSNFKKISIGQNVEKHDLVAELSFNLAKISFERLLPIANIVVNSDEFQTAYLRSISFLKKYESVEKSLVLNKEEVSESYALANQYAHYFSYVEAKEIEFSPIISGSGFLGRCEADLSVDNTLYEIKTVSRNIAGKDIKQLILYLALQYSSGTRKWLNAGFINPRKSLHYKFSVDHLIYRTSGGRSSSEVFKDIIDFLENRGIEIDAIF